MNWKKEYIRRLDVANIKDLNVEDVQSIKNNNLPETLYKYRPASDEAIDNLENDTVYLNKPSDYNDPFEFVEYLDFKKTNVALDKYLKDNIVSNLTEHNPVPDKIKEKALKSDYPIRVISEHLFKKNKNEIEIMLNSADENLKKLIIDRQIEKIKVIQDMMKVCSFCESPRQLLMWSHYADNHRGFCVEYDINKWPQNDFRKWILFPVIYKENFYDSTNHLITQITDKSSFNALYSLLSGSTKSIDWEYEKEWRFIINNSKPFNDPNLSMDCQSRVFLGSRMSDEKRERIISICLSRGIKIFDAVPSPEKYELNFIPIGS